ncbi:MAG: hydrogenase maturation factor [Lachnospiraceae bacterium]|nr:hydrogenase maturation factor [Lachnospiraceae bacterium]
MKTGKLPESALKRSVLKQVHTGNHRISHPVSGMTLENTKGAAIGSDCAFFAASDGQVLAWCAQEAAVAGKADAGELAILVQKCANNLAAAGARPASAQISIMLPKDMEEPDLKELMRELVKACGQHGMEIAGGDTNISPFVTAPILTITAIGLVEAKELCDVSKAKAGQDLVITKWIGLEGTAQLAKAFEERLLERYPAYLVEEAASFEKYLSVEKEAQIAAANGAAAMHDLSAGGVFGALWELAEGAGLGLNVDLKRIPIRQETVEVCEVCGVNPYEMRSCGSLLIAAEDGEALVRALEEAGISASLAGKLTDGGDRVIQNGEEIRFLDRPRGIDVIAECLENKSF